MSPIDPNDLIQVHITCSIRARYDQTVIMPRQHFEELSQKIEDDDDVEEEVMSYLDWDDPQDTEIPMGEIDIFEIVETKPTE